MCRKKDSPHRLWYYLWFQVPTGQPGTHPYREGSLLLVRKDGMQPTSERLTFDRNRDVYFTSIVSKVKYEYIGEWKES